MYLLLHSKLYLQKETSIALCSLFVSDHTAKWYLSARRPQRSRSTDTILALKWTQFRVRYVEWAWQEHPRFYFLSLNTFYL